MSGAWLDGAPPRSARVPSNEAGAHRPWSPAQELGPTMAPLPAGGPGAGAGRQESVTRALLRRTSTGWRGLNRPTAIRLQWAATLLLIAACSLITDAAVAHSATPMPAGMMMWVTATAMLVAAALGSMLAPAQRPLIIEQLRHYLLGMSVVPATALAVLMFAVRGVAADAATRGEVLASLLGTPMVAVFLATLIVPAAVFIRLIAGTRTLNRSSADDEEVMRTYSRADGFMS